VHDLDRDFDRSIAIRLAALEARVPVRGAPAAIPGGRRRRLALSLTAAPVLLLALVATATAGAAVVASNLAQGHPGIQNDGQPMAGADMECLTPPQAEALLAAHGLTNVVWQVEAGDATRPDGGKGRTTTTQQASAPQHGYVVPGSVLEDGSVIMVVDQRVDATAGGACPDLPMP
jgi:hypothetical protein